MSDKDLLTQVFTLLLGTSAVTDLVGTRITPESVPIKVKTSKVTVRIDTGESLETGVDTATLYINVWVNSEAFENPFTKMREIKEEIIKALNYSASSLTHDDYKVYGIKKEASDDLFETDTQYWRGLIRFIINQEDISQT